MSSADVPFHRSLMALDVCHFISHYFTICSVYSENFCSSDLSVIRTFVDLAAVMIT